ncbi:unnamed protein product [Choristocarpus tenellus]
MMIRTRLSFFLLLLVVLYCVTPLHGKCLKTGKPGTCDIDGCCDSTAKCRKNGRCRLPHGSSCDKNKRCIGTNCVYGTCRPKDYESSWSVSTESPCSGCDGNSDNSIDWECLLGPGSLDEVDEFGGETYACSDATSSTPCTTFDLEKSQKRTEVKVNANAHDWVFYEGETWVVKYSFRPVAGMVVTDRFTHIGQVKPAIGKSMVNGDALMSITANDKGVNVRFSNQGGSIEDYLVVGDYLSWEDCLGSWTHVKITSTFGSSMEVKLSGAISGSYSWPSDERPVAWSNEESDSVRLKLGLYHSTDNVGDGKVDYKDISVVGPDNREMAIASGPNGNC